jgi:threonine dehydratase
MDFEVTRTDIELAASRIAPHIRRTPVLELGHVLSDDYSLALKLEHLQVTGSFKTRGAFSAMTAIDVPEAGVVAASGGNFGAAVAYAATRLGHRSTIFVPETSPDEKINRIRAHGAEVRVISGYYDEAFAASQEFVVESHAYSLHAYDQPAVVAGQGTIATEIEDQAEPDELVVAVGGGGLIAGIASWVRDDARVVSVEPETCRSFHAAREAGSRVEVDVSGVAASSLGARQVGEHAWAARGWIDESVLVDDEAIIAAQRWVWSETRLAVEPAAATTVAALMSGRHRPEPGTRVVSVLSGANLDPATLG